MNKNVFNKMIDRIIDPEIQECLSSVDSIVGFKLSKEDEQPFLYFHNYINNTQLQFISSWLSDSRLEIWYHRLTEGFLGNVYNAFACVLYHHERLRAIETAVIENVEKYNYRKVLGKSTLAIGNSLKWDFEYQAFILAYRRCLDYLTRAICAYFKDETHSFRKLGKFLEGKKSNRVACALIPLHKKYCALFKFVLSEGKSKSTRDKISHYKHVPVGTINLSQRGFVLVRGDESLGQNGNVLLSEVIDGYVSNIKRCLKEMICCFVDKIRALEKDNV